jgi:formiminotetrahydrofolate cyclodeaminase
MNPLDTTVSIGGFLDATAAKKPTPGGGAVAALAGALACSIGEMVLNYSVGKKDLLEHHESLQRALAELQQARWVLCQLMIEDQLAYQAVSETKKLPESTPDREARLNAAVVAAIRCPQAIAATALAVIDIADRVADVGNRWLLSDLAVSVELAMATVRCGVYNIRVNLADVPESDRQTLMRQSQQMIDHGVRVLRSVLPRIWARIES